MPPTPGLYIGRDTVVIDWADGGFEGVKGLRAVHACVNRQPAMGEGDDARRGSSDRAHFLMRQASA